MNADDAEIKTIFLDEAREILFGIERCLLHLEKNHSDLTNLNELFRFAHNLKGASGLVGFTEMNAITHKFESLLLCIKESRVPIAHDVCNLLFRTKDYLLKMIEELYQNLEIVHSNSSLQAELCAALSASHNGTSQSLEAKHLAPIELPPIADTPIYFKCDAAANSNKTSADDSIRVKFSRIETLLNNIGELSILQNVLHQQTVTHATSVPLLLRETAISMSKIIKETQTIMMGLRMVPLRQTFRKMERIVRDTSAELGKEAELIINGDETEIDKMVLEQVTDPLIHIIRNAVDHGLEENSDRCSTQKTKVGKIFLSAFHRAGYLIIEARDDGKGLDPEKLIRKAVEKGLIPKGTQLSREDAFQLIFTPGFSTKDEVTNVSGRGVGMDVVKTNITALQGQVEIESELGQGTCLRIILPLTMAIVDSVIVRVEAERFVVPLAQVSEFLSLQESDFESALGRTELLSLRGETLPVFRLTTLLNRPVGTKTKLNQKALVIRNTKNQGVAVLVDQIISQQQVVVKPLGQELRQQVGLVGFAILGDGRPAIILDLLELLSKNQNSKRIYKNIKQTGEAA